MRLYCQRRGYAMIITFDGKRENVIERITRELASPVVKGTLKDAPHDFPDDVSLVITNYVHGPSPTAPLLAESRNFLQRIHRCRDQPRYIPLILIAPYETDAQFRARSTQHLEEATQLTSPDLVIVERNYGGTDIRFHILPPVRRLLDEPQFYRNNPRIVTPVGVLASNPSGGEIIMNCMKLLPVAEYFGDKSRYGRVLSPLPRYLSALR